MTFLRFMTFAILCFGLAQTAEARRVYFAFDPSLSQKIFSRLQVSAVQRQTNARVQLVKELDGLECIESQADGSVTARCRLLEFSVFNPVAVSAIFKSLPGQEHVGGRRAKTRIKTLGDLTCGIGTKPLADGTVSQYCSTKTNAVFWEEEN